MSATRNKTGIGENGKSVVGRANGKVGPNSGTIQDGIFRMSDRDHAVPGRGTRIFAQPRAVFVAHQSLAKPLCSNH